MPKIIYSKGFLKYLKKLDPQLQKETEYKIELFRNEQNNKNLEIHKLKGRFKGFYSFSVNYKNRVLFSYNNNKTVALLHDVGDHDIYR